MNTSGRIRPAGRAWVAGLLALILVLGMSALASAAPPKQRTLSVKIAEPENGATVSGTIRVTASTTGTPVWVQYRVDGSDPVAMTNTGGGQWSASWNTATVTYGRHSIRVTAADRTGAVVKATAQVTVDNRAMTIQVTNPAEGASVSGKVQLQASVASPGTVVSVTYAVGSGGTQVPMTFNSAQGYWEATWDTGSLPPGSVTLYFRATDKRQVFPGYTVRTATATRNVSVGGTARSAGEWTHSRGDLQNRAYTPDAYGTSFASLWTNAWGVHSSRLVLYNGILYAASNTSPGYLSGLDAATGKLIFNLRMESVVSPAAVGPDAAYVTVLRNGVVAVKPDGTTLWRSSITATSAPLITPAGILAGDSAGKVYALDPKTGATLWSVQTGETSGFMQDYMPVYADGKLYLPGMNSIPVIDIATRRVAFTINVAPWQGLMYDGGLLYVANMYSLTAYDGGTGQPKWSFGAPSYIGTPPAAAQGIVIVGADEPKLYALDGATGQVLWSQVLDTYGSASGSPVIAGDLVYTGAYFGGLKVFDLHTGQYQTTLLPGVEVGGAVPAGGVLYVPDSQWGTYALKKQ